MNNNMTQQSTVEERLNDIIYNVDLSVKQSGELRQDIKELIQLAEQKAREDEREKVLKEFIEWGRNPHKNPFISTPTEDN